MFKLLISATKHVSKHQLGNPIFHLLSVCHERLANDINKIIAPTIFQSPFGKSWIFSGQVRSPLASAACALCPSSSPASDWQLASSLPQSEMKVFLEQYDSLASFLPQKKRTELKNRKDHYTATNHNHKQNQIPPGILASLCHGKGTERSTTRIQYT